MTRLLTAWVMMSFVTGPLMGVWLGAIVKEPDNE